MNGEGVEPSGSSLPREAPEPITALGAVSPLIVTVADLLAGKQPRLPMAILPYIQAAPKPGSEALPPVLGGTRKWGSRGTPTSERLCPLG